jgi:hypothetical protein
MHQWDKGRCVAQFVVTGRRALGAVFPPFNKVLRPTSGGELGPVGKGGGFNAKATHLQLRGYLVRYTALVSWLPGKEPNSEMS